MKMRFFCFSCDHQSIFLVVSETSKPDSYYVELVIKCEECQDERKLLVYDQTLAKWKEQDKEL